MAAAPVPSEGGPTGTRMYLLRMMFQMGLTATFTAAFFLGPLLGALVPGSLDTNRVTVKEASEPRLVYWEPSPPAPKGAPEGDRGAEQGEAEEASDEAPETDLGVKRPGAAAGEEVAVAARRGLSEGHGSHRLVRPREGRHQGTRRGPRCEPSTDAIARVDTATWMVDRELVEEYATVRRAQELVGWVARHEDDRGRPDGFVVGGIRCGSPLHLAGIRNGDVVHDVNGISIHSIPGALRAWSKLKKANLIDVNLTRRGKPMRMSYEIG